MKNESFQKNYKAFPYLIIIAILLIFLCIAGTYAAYTNAGYRKGVISTNGSPEMFYSEILKGYAKSEYDNNRYLDRDWMMMFSEAADQNTIKVDINVYNHAKDSPTVANSMLIKYDITFSLTGHTSGLTSQYKVNGESFSDDGTLVLGDQILEPNELSKNSYTVTIPYSDAKNVAILVEAKPIDGYWSATDNCLLARNLKFMESTVTESAFKWSGTFSDKDNTNNSKDFAAFNYVIQGTGAGSVTLTWDTAKYQLDPLFIQEKKGDSVEAQKNGSFEFEVDSSTQNYYLVQFFRMTDPPETEDGASGDWSRVESEIKIEAVSAEE